MSDLDLSEEYSRSTLPRFMKYGLIGTSVLIGIAALAVRYADLSWLPGIAESDARDGSEFRIGFASALYSGLITGLATGLITGVIVGLFLWRFQADAERKRIQREMSREAATFVERLRLVLSAKPLIPRAGESAAALLPSIVSDAVELVMSSPIDQWAATLPHLRQLHQATRTLQQKHYAYVATAGRLDEELEIAVRNWNAGHGTHSLNDADYLTYYLAKVRGFEGATILGRIDRQLSELPKFENAVAVISEMEKLEILCQEWLSANNNLIAATNNLQSWLASN